MIVFLARKVVSIAHSVNRAKLVNLLLKMALNAWLAHLERTRPKRSMMNA
jgi:hypothetical protein